MQANNCGFNIYDVYVVCLFLENKDDKKVYFNGKVVGQIYSIFNKYCLIKIKEDFKEEKLTVFGQPLTLLN